MYSIQYLIAMFESLKAFLARIKSRFVPEDPAIIRTSACGRYRLYEQKTYGSISEIPSSEVPDDWKCQTKVEVARFDGDGPLRVAQVYSSAKPLKNRPFEAYIEGHLHGLHYEIIPVVLGDISGGHSQPRGIEGLQDACLRTKKSVDEVLSNPETRERVSSAHVVYFHSAESSITDKFKFLNRVLQRLFRWTPSFWHVLHHWFPCLINYDHPWINIYNAGEGTHTFFRGAGPGVQEEYWRFVQGGEDPTYGRALSQIFPGVSASDWHATVGPKKREMHMADAHSILTMDPFWRFRYRLGWICPCPPEAKAARNMLDEIYALPSELQHDANQWILGRISTERIALVCLSKYGAVSAKTAAQCMRDSFPAMDSCFLVGVGGGVPASGRDIHLGDIVVSTAFVYEDKGALVTIPVQAESDLLCAAQAVQIDEDLVPHFALLPPEPHSDILPQHRRRMTVHFGSMGGVDTVIRDAGRRDEIGRKRGVICLEMECAGACPILECLSIRGISDLADCDKNDAWQPRAAALAALFARQLVLYIIRERERRSLVDFGNVFGFC